MPLQQGANIVDARIVGCNDESHTCRLTNEGKSLQLLTNKANEADASRLLSGIPEGRAGRRRWVSSQRRAGPALSAAS
jgi:hypothetical protein